MYQKHFELIELPFSLQAEANYFVGVKGHMEALKMLLLGLSHADGFMKVTGDVGTGKTFLSNKLRKTLGAKYVTIYLSTPCVNEMDLFFNVARIMKLDGFHDLPRYQLIEQIAARLVQFKKEGKRVLFLIDESQAMDASALEALRLLNYYQSERHSLFDLILFGQTELDEKLSEPLLRALAQRIVFSYRLQSLNYTSMVQYIRTRLHIAGYRGKMPFTPVALWALYIASQGVPRMINVLCHKAMMVAYREGVWQIGYREAREAILNTQILSYRASAYLWKASLAWSVTAVALGGVGIYLLSLATTVV